MSFNEMNTIGNPLHDKLHKEQELFEKAYGYIREHY